MLQQTYFDKAAADGWKFNLSESEIRQLAEISHALVTGALHYTEAEGKIRQMVGSNFLYREGNKRIVLVSVHGGYVVKISKLAGFEGIRDNSNEQISCLYNNGRAKYSNMKYAPQIIGMWGTNEFPGLVLVQQRHKEILEELAKNLPQEMGGGSQNRLLASYITNVVHKGYALLSKMITQVAEENFVSDLKIVGSAANLSINAQESFAILDWGSILPKNGYEVRCPRCGAPMIYHMEDLESFTTSNSLDLTTIKPTYRCVAEPTHEQDPDVFFNKLTSGDQTVIMTQQEAVAKIQQLKAGATMGTTNNMGQDSPSMETFIHQGTTYQLGVQQHNTPQGVVRRLFQNGQPLQYGVTAAGVIVQG